MGKTNRVEEYKKLHFKRILTGKLQPDGLTEYK